MTKVVSEDALRRGLEKIPEGSGVIWLREHLERSVLPLLKAAWILDVDTTVKVLYGRFWCGNWCGFSLVRGTWC